MKHTRLSSLVVLCTLGLLIVLVAGSQPATAATTELAAQIQVDRSWFDASQELLVRMTISNPGSETVGLLRWQTPIDGIEHDIMTITRDSQPVRYTGILAKRSAPAAEDFLMLAPGEELTFMVDPSAAYDMSQQGNYTVQYAARLEGRLVAKSGRLERTPIKVISNQVSFWVDGAAATWKKQDEPPVLTEGSLAYESCTTSQQTILQTAHSNATTISGLSVNHLDANPSGSGLYTTWFGAYTTSRFATVSSHYDAISDAFQNAPVTYNCKCKKNYFAYVYANEPYRIYVCRVFWQVSDLGRDSRAGTLIHEMSHFYVVASTSDYVYGETGAKDLALTSPDEAIFNADNHEYFAEDQL